MPTMPSKFGVTRVDASFKSHTVVLYRTGDSDSHALAQYYQALYGLLDAQLIPLPCSASEVLSSYSQFQTQIETPLLAVIPDGTKVIVVGYNVPGGFMDGGDVISTTSRLSRIRHAYSKNLPNPLFDRRDMTLMDTADFDTALICSRIDGPTLAAAKKIVDSARQTRTQGTANGTFNIDPYPVFSDAAAADYADELAQFVARTLPLLNLTVVTTVSADPYQDLVLPFVANDSFTWMCGSPEAGDSFFHDSSSAKFFLYNADTDSAVTIRDSLGNRWPTLALRNGYPSTSGSMSPIGADHYIRPRPMFHSLMSGGVIGEAYLFSVPFLDSPETLLGDPFVTAAFPASLTAPVQLDIPTATAFILDDLAAAAASLSRRARLTDEIRQVVHTGCDLDAMVDLLRPAQSLYLSMQDVSPSDIRLATISGLSLITPTRGESVTAAKFATFLSDNSLTVPRVLADVYNAQGFAVNDTFVSAAGTWHADFILETMRTDQEVVYQFELEIASDEYFDHVLATKDSASDPSFWTYQKEIDNFEGIPSAGVPSSYATRRIRYSGTGLTRTNAYYLRFRQKVGATKYDWVYQKLVVST